MKRKGHRHRKPHRVAVAVEYQPRNHRSVANGNVLGFYVQKHIAQIRQNRVHRKQINLEKLRVHAGDHHYRVLNHCAGAMIHAGIVCCGGISHGICEHRRDHHPVACVEIHRIVRNGVALTHNTTADIHGGQTIAENRVGNHIDEFLLHGVVGRNSKGIKQIKPQTVADGVVGGVCLNPHLPVNSGVGGIPICVSNSVGIRQGNRIRGFKGIPADNSLIAGKMHRDIGNRVAEGIGRRNADFYPQAVAGIPVKHPAAGHIQLGGVVVHIGVAGIPVGSPSAVGTTDRTGVAVIVNGATFLPGYGEHLHLPGGDVYHFRIPNLAGAVKDVCRHTDHAGERAGFEGHLRSPVNCVNRVGLERVGRILRNQPRAGGKTTVVPGGAGFHIRECVYRKHHGGQIRHGVAELVKYVCDDLSLIWCVSAGSDVVECHRKAFGARLLGQKSYGDRPVGGIRLCVNPDHPSADAGREKRSKTSIAVGHKPRGFN